MKHAYGKSGGPRAEIAQMRKPAHTKKVCGPEMTILLIPAHQKVFTGLYAPSNGSKAVRGRKHQSERFSTFPEVSGPCKLV